MQFWSTGDVCNTSSFWWLPHLVRLDLARSCYESGTAIGRTHITFFLTTIDNLQTKSCAPELVFGMRLYPRAVFHCCCLVCDHTTTTNNNVFILFSVCSLRQGFYKFPKVASSFWAFMILPQPRVAGTTGVLYWLITHQTSIKLILINWLIDSRNLLWASWS